MKYNFKKQAFVTTNIKLPLEMFDRIKVIAESENVTFGEVVTSFCDVAIIEYELERKDLLLQSVPIEDNKKDDKFDGEQHFVSTEKEIEENQNIISKEEYTDVNDECMNLVVNYLKNIKCVGVELLFNKIGYEFFPDELAMERVLDMYALDSITSIRKIKNNTYKYCDIKLKAQYLA